MDETLTVRGRGRERREGSERDKRGGVMKREGGERGGREVKGGE